MTRRDGRELRHIIGDVVAVAVGHEGNRSGVVLGDSFGKPRSIISCYCSS
jgi:hypothetical protein